ncbi:MAG TPA: SMI1/KNR4 family protein [Tepidisphaeraceae bacterium]|jgi:hypothetical protein|nr:SMI1/KNR4 family protein [Tepidisphaeraceae bacterium]
MVNTSYPWRDGRSLSDVLADSRGWLCKRRIIEDGGGASESAIAAAEARLGRPLPDDIRELHRCFRFMRIFSADGPEDFGLYSIEQDEISWERPTDAIPAQDWENAEALLIGQNHYGDSLFWVTGHRTQPDGCIGICDHELAIGNLQFAIMARSLAEFIAKIVIVGGLTGAFEYELELDDDWEPLEQRLGLAALTLISNEYDELNPSALQGPS